MNSEDIKKALEGKLPGLDSHKKMLPPNRDITLPNAGVKVKHSSVILLLYEQKKQLFACLIKRPSHMKYHAGQISLPGGRMEKNELPLETAYRETFEEIGIQQNNIQILGNLSELYVEVSKFWIHPFVGWLDKQPDFILNQDEVEKMVLFPLLEYKNKFEKVELETITGPITVPCMKFNGEIIWGATAMILSEFFDLLPRI